MAIAILGFSAACAASRESIFGSGDNGAPADSGAGGTNSGLDAVGSGDFSLSASGAGGGAGTFCDAGPDEDKDNDGFTINQGDCNDCDPNVNPNAIDVIGGVNGGGDGGGAPYVPVDEDCDGVADNPPEICDGNLLVTSADPMDGARAIELCKISTAPNDWGVVNASWVLPNGSPSPLNQEYALGVGMLSGFGPYVNPQAGSRMLGLSSGTARQPGDPGYQSPSGYTKYLNNTGHPFGFPKESPSCGSAVTGTCNDGAALELILRAPSNATGFRFNFKFYTYEWPVYVCSQYNDFFAAILEPFPMGQFDGNITFDSLGNPISVNNAFFDVCGCSGGPPCYAGGLSFSCSLGTNELVGTGFEGHAATGWLQTQAPIVGGTEFKVRFLAYDSGDTVLDSTGLVDNWQWIAESGVNVSTDPVPDPK